MIFYIFHKKEINQNHAEVKSLIHHLTQRVDKIDEHLLTTRSLTERVAYVYLMRKLGTNEYKLGKSFDPIDRKSLFESMNIDLDMIRQIKFKNEATAIVWETTFKKHFAHRKIKGEWFDLTPQDLKLFTDIADVFDRMPQ